MILLSLVVRKHDRISNRRYVTTMNGTHVLVEYHSLNLNFCIFVYVYIFVSLFMNCSCRVMI